MAWLPAKDRNQLQIQSLETSISKANPVRFGEAFVEQLEMARLGLSIVESKMESRLLEGNLFFSFGSCFSTSIS